MPKQRAFDWKEVASWFDTEGYSRIVTHYGRQTGAKVGITQNEVEPLLAMRDFLTLERIICYVGRKGGSNELRIYRSEAVADFLSHVSRHLRTHYRILQLIVVESFLERRTVVRRTMSPVDQSRTVAGKIRHQQLEHNHVVNTRKFDWKETASWFDTEGSAFISHWHGRPFQAVVSIGQNEAEPLVEIARFLGKARVKGVVYRRSGSHDLRIQRQNSVGAFLDGVEPFLRTRSKSCRLSTLRSFLNRPKRCGRSRL